MNYILKYKQAVFAHYLSDVIPFIPLLHLESLHVSAVLRISHHQVVNKN
jgi:hypothetical protein